MFTHADVVERWNQVETKSTEYTPVEEFTPYDFADYYSEESLHIYVLSRSEFPSLLEFWIVVLRSILDGRWREHYFKFGDAWDIALEAYPHDVRKLSQRLRKPLPDALVFEGRLIEAQGIDVGDQHEAIVATFDDRYVAVSYWYIA